MHHADRWLTDTNVVAAVPCVVEQADIVVAEHRQLRRQAPLVSDGCEGTAFLVADVGAVRRSYDDKFAREAARDV